LAFDGLLKPLIFLTNWSEAARISSAVTGGSKLKRVLMFLHISASKYQNAHRCESLPIIDLVTRLVRFKDNPDPGACAAAPGDKVMHANLRIGETTVLVSDGRCEGEPSFEGFSLSLTVANEAEADRLFAALADRGQVQVPLTKTFFSPRFGMVDDRFGVSWMIYVAPEEQKH
jgi:PhnB protein